MDDDGGSSSEAINVAAMELEALDSPPPSGSCKSITTAVGADVALTWGGGSGGEGIGGTDSDCRFVCVGKRRYLVCYLPDFLY